MTEEAAPDAPPRAGSVEASVALLALALAFLKIALASLGGGLSAWALRVIVDERRWLTEQEFLSAFTMCRILPGPNQVNMAVYVGARLRGVAGAAAALLGLTLVPLAIALTVGVLYFRHHGTPVLQATMSGLVAGAAGMTLATGFRLARGCMGQPVAVVLALLAFLGIVLLKWPLLVVLALLAPLGVAWAWPRHGAA